MTDDLLRPIMGIENRTPQEVFDIMCERMKSVLASPSPPASETLSKSQRFVLEWLGKEDFSALGECQGSDLDALVVAGLAKVSGQRVSLTDAGQAAIRALSGNTKP